MYDMPEQNTLRAVKCHYLSPAGKNTNKKKFNLTVKYPRDLVFLNAYNSNSVNPISIIL